MPENMIPGRAGVKEKPTLERVKVIACLLGRSGTVAVELKPVPGELAREHGGMPARTSGGSCNKACPGLVSGTGGGPSLRSAWTAEGGRPYTGVAWEAFSASKRLASYLVAYWLHRRPKMDEKIVQEILHELYSSLEGVETQSGAILQLIKDKNLASEEELAGYLEQAGNASEVRWRAVRARVDHLVSSAMNAEEEGKKEPAGTSEKRQEVRSADKVSGDKGDVSGDEKEGQDAPRVARGGATGADNKADADGEKSQSLAGEREAGRGKADRGEEKNSEKRSSGENAA